jgi:hypothetical protein
MAAIRVEVTAEHIAAGAKPTDPDDPNWHEVYNRYWAVPVELAIAELTGVGVDVDGGGGDGTNIATIGTREDATLVVDLPPLVSGWLDDRWNGRGEGEPIAFDLEIPDWLVDLVRKAAL